MVLRCRAQARAYFLQLRSDVRVKLQLLNSKHGELIWNTYLIFKILGQISSKLCIFPYAKSKDILAVQDLTEQLEKWTKVLLAYYEEVAEISNKANVFPIDIDLSTVVDAQ